MPTTRQEVHDDRYPRYLTSEPDRLPSYNMREDQKPAVGDADRAREEFERFFARHHRELSRLAFLLSGDRQSAEDLTAEVFLAAWRRWDTVWTLDEPFAYVRRIMVNIAASRLRRISTERRRLALIYAGDREATSNPDPGVTVDVRAALLRLPVRRRACVVLRHAFDVSEIDVAAALGISVGTVKSQTSKGMSQLQKILNAPFEGGWEA
jgi:RNA polymerase sigma-70 factor (sigma-E family)